MATLNITQIPVMSDNYVYLLHQPKTNVTAVVDPAVEKPVIEELQKQNLNLDFIFNTHHHYDHVGANKALKEKYGCKVYGSKKDAHRIPGIDETFEDGDSFSFGQLEVNIFFTPGHTSGHICFYFPQTADLFVGDTMFAMGCGRLFEGSAAQMWKSLSTLAALPEETKVYCAHEYTLANAQFALSVDGTNKDLLDRFKDVQDLRAKNIPTIPTSIGLEKKTNPFLRVNDSQMRSFLNLEEASESEVFAAIRARKDSF